MNLANLIQHFFLNCRAGLSLGTSKHWSVAMKAITGQEKMDAGPLLEYFQPLYEYLKMSNQAQKTMIWEITLTDMYFKLLFFKLL